MPDTETENPLKVCERNLRSSLSDVRFSAVISLREIGESAIPLLLSAAKDRDAKVSEAAAQALSELGEVGARALRDLLHKEMRISQGVWKSTLKRMALYFFVLCGMGLLEKCLSAHPVLQSILKHSESGLLIIFFVNMVISQVHVRRSAIAALQNTEDIKLTGLFALFLNDRSEEIRSIAKDVLTRLLPKAQASDAQCINRDEMQALVDALRKQKQDAGLMLALLKGLEQIGDERALTNVAALTDDSSVSPSVKQAARDCLPYLQIWAEQAKQAQTLLRASSGNETAPETLLRPAAGVSTNDERQLLRPKLENMGGFSGLWWVRGV